MSAHTHTHIPQLVKLVCMRFSLRGGGGAVLAPPPPPLLPLPTITTTTMAAAAAAKLLLFQLEKVRARLLVSAQLVHTYSGASSFAQVSLGFFDNTRTHTHTQSATTAAATAQFRTFKSLVQLIFVCELERARERERERRKRRPASRVGSEKVCQNKKFALLVAC